MSDSNQAQRQLSDVDTIFAALLVGGIDLSNKVLNVELNHTDWYKEKKETFKYAYPTFFSRVNINIFTGEYNFLYTLLKDTDTSVFTANQLNDLLDRHKVNILKSKSMDIKEISGVALELTTDMQFDTFKTSVLNLYKKLSEATVSLESFNVSLNKYITEYLESYLKETYANASMILNNGLELRIRGKNTYLRGLEDSEFYIAYRKEQSEKLFKNDVTEHVLIDDIWFEHEVKSGDALDEGILDMGIDEIDNIKGKLRRTNLLTIAGPSKGGKTRFTNYLVYRARRAGLNVCVWVMEGTKEEWIANQISLMIRTNEGIALDSKSILENRLENEATKQLVMAYKLDFAMNQSLGKLSFIDGTGYVENFLDKIKSHYDTVNKFDVIVVDQLITIQSLRNKEKVSRLSEAYITFKDFIKNNCGQPLAIVPAQLKPGAVNMLRTKKDSELDIDSVAECSEVIRSSDEVIGLYGSKEDKAINQISFYDIVTRHSSNFETFVCKAELGCCYFESMSQY